MKLKLRKSLQNNRGFSLFELIVVIFITGLLFVGGFTAATEIRNQQKRTETAAYLEDVKQALHLYINLHGVLPRADTSIPGDGFSDTGPNQIFLYSKLPFKTLGIPAEDSWGNTFLYYPSPELTQNRFSTCNALRQDPRANKYSPGTPNYLDDYRSGAGVYLPPDYVAAKRKPFVVLSTGKNSRLDEIMGGNNSYLNRLIVHSETSSFDDLISFADIYSLRNWARCDQL